jgi:hypothetical protein
MDQRATFANNTTAPVVTVMTKKSPARGSGNDTVITVHKDTLRMNDDAAGILASAALISSEGFQTASKEPVVVDTVRNIGESLGDFIESVANKDPDDASDSTSAEFDDENRPLVDDAVPEVDPSLNEYIGHILRYLDRRCVKYDKRTSTLRWTIFVLHVVATVSVLLESLPILYATITDHPHAKAITAVAAAAQLLNVFIFVVSRRLSRVKDHVAHLHYESAHLRFRLKTETLASRADDGKISGKEFNSICNTFYAYHKRCKEIKQGNAHRVYAVPEDNL